MKINLSDKVASNPIVSEPPKEKILENWQKYIATSKIIDPYVEAKKEKRNKRKKRSKKEKTHHAERSDLFVKLLNAGAENIQ